MSFDDNGGAQQETLAHDVATLVMRDATERPDCVEAGALKFIVTNEEMI